MTSAVILFSRWPEPGRVKTRLAARVGPDAAVRLYRAFVEDALTAMRRARRGLDGCRLMVAFTPEERAGEMRRWLGEDLDYLAQSGAGLSERLEAAFETAFRAGAEAVLALGGDLPDLTDAAVVRAVERLAAGAGCALAPSDDGGYSLIGFRRDAFVPEAFRGVAWGTASVLEQTLAALGSIGLQAALLPVLPDVDDLDDLVRFWRERGGSPSRTATLLAGGPSLLERLRETATG